MISFFETHGEVGVWDTDNEYKDALWEMIKKTRDGPVSRASRSQPQNQPDALKSFPAGDGGETDDKEPSPEGKAELMKLAAELGAGVEKKLDHIKELVEKAKSLGGAEYIAAFREIDDLAMSIGSLVEESANEKCYGFNQTLFRTIADGSVREHDIRSAVAVISGRAQLIARDPKDAATSLPKLETAVAKIKNTVNLLRKITRLEMKRDMKGKVCVDLEASAGGGNEERKSYPAGGEKFDFVTSDRGDLMTIDDSGKVRRFVRRSDRTKEDVLKLWRGTEKDAATLNAIGLALSNIAALNALKPVPEPYPATLTAGQVAAPSNIDVKLPGIEGLVALHNLTAPAVIAKLRSEGRKVMLSGNLFREEDIGPIKANLDENLIQIATPEEIRSASTNRDTKPGSIACVVTREDFAKHWHSTSARTGNKATLLVLDINNGAESSDRDFAYIYVEGLVGLVSAMADKEKDRVKIERYLSMLFDTRLDGAALEEFLKDNDSVKFALHAILKLKPLERIDVNRMDDYKKNVDRLLEAA